MEALGGGTSDPGSVAWTPVIGGRQHHAEVAEIAALTAAGPREVCGRPQMGAVAGSILDARIFIHRVGK